MQETFSIKPFLLINSFDLTNILISTYQIGYVCLNDLFILTMIKPVYICAHDTLTCKVYSMEIDVAEFQYSYMGIYTLNVNIYSFIRISFF